METCFNVEHEDFLVIFLFKLPQMFIYLFFFCLCVKGTGHSEGNTSSHTLLFTVDTT